MSCDFSIVVVSFYRAPELRLLFSSLDVALQGLGGKTFEVLTIVNGVDPEIEPLAKEFEKKSGAWRFLYHSEKMRPPEARNRGLEQAQGDWIVFFDDDVVLPRHYFSCLLSAINQFSDAVVIGGPNLTPADSGLFEIISGRALSSRMVVGPFFKRYSRETLPRQTLNDFPFILCNLAAKRKHMKPFPTNFPLGEENAMLLELLVEKQSFAFIPELYVFHRRRPSPAQFASQILKYGRGRGLLLRHYGLRARSNRLLIISALILGLILFSCPFSLASFYFLYITFAAVRVSRSLSAFFWSVVAILICHIFYPLGVLLGGME